MATTVESIIEAARDQHPAFDERRSPTKVLVRALSGYHRSLCVKAVNANESILAAEEIIALPLADFDAGVELPAHQYIHGADVYWTNGVDRSPLRLVPWGARNDGGRFPCAYIHGKAPGPPLGDGGDMLHLMGLVGDWTPFVSIHLSYVPAPADFTALADELLLPDTADDACTAFLASFMAARGAADPGVPPISLSFFAQQAAQAEEAFLTDVFLRRGNQENRIREVRSFS